jgi:hypothetical protein
LLTSDEAERLAWCAVFLVGAKGNGKPHGLRLKVVESCVVIFGDAVLSAAQLRAWANDLMQCVERARAWVEPERGPFGRTKKREGVQR